MSAETVLDLSRLPLLIIAELGVASCALYLYDPDGALVRRAREGAPEGAGPSRAGGERIVAAVGRSGETVNLDDLTRHPSYADPDGGDSGSAEPPAAPVPVLAMPLRRAGRTLGVICLHGSQPRAFLDDEVESLAMVTMLLAELLAAGAPQPAASGGSGRHFRGVSLASGVVRGRIRLGPALREPARMLADDPVAEQARLVRAMDRLSTSFGHLLDGERPDAGGREADAAREVIETTRMLWAGTGWLRRVGDALEAGMSAEAAVHRVATDVRRRMRDLADPLLRERLADLEDIASGLLAALDEDHAAAYQQLPPGTILVVRRLGPAKLLHWQARGIAGLVIEEASPAGHAAILARSMGIPALGGTRGAFEAADNGADAILDADEERLILRPEPSVSRHYDRVMTASLMREATGASLRNAPSTTRDGVPFSLLLNAGLPQELARLDETGADGVGLFRTEIFVLARGDLPDEADQTRFYRKVLDAAGARPIVFRTHDLGGDKLLPGAEPSDEQNPAMGWRSLRVALDRPELLARQARALLRAADGRPLRVMFPMVARIDEFEAARALLERERDALGATTELSVGAMLEVPALLLALDALFACADFVSIGSNDLMQFLFAADRGTPRLASRYDLFAEPMLRLVEQVAAAAARAGKPLSLCGEIAARPLEALVLASLGVTRLSMSPAGVLRVKEALRSVDLGRFAAGLARIRAADLSGGSIRAHVMALAAEQEIPS